MKIRKSLQIMEVRYSNSSNANIELTFHDGSREYNPEKAPRIYLDNESCHRFGLTIVPEVVNQQLAFELELRGNYWQIQENYSHATLVNVRSLKKITEVIFFQDTIREDTEYLLDVITPSMGGHFSPIIAPHFQVGLKLTAKEYVEALKTLRHNSCFELTALLIEPANKQLPE